MGVNSAELIHDRLETVAQRAKDRCAIVDTDGAYTNFRSLWQRSARIAGRLVDDGVRRGDRVLLIGGRTSNRVCAYVALLRIGAVGVMYEGGWPAERIIETSASIDARWGLSISELAGCDSANIEAVGDQAKRPERTDGNDSAAQTGSDPAVILHTAGTTGTPKFICHSHRSLLAGVDLLSVGFSQFMKRPGAATQYVGLSLRHAPGTLDALRGRKVWLTAFPVFRVAGHSLLLQALLSGETLVCADGMSAREILEVLDRHRVNVAAVSPVTGEFLARAQQQAGQRLTHLLVIGLGSDRANSDLPARLRRAFHCPVVVGYGATEFGGGIISTSLYGRVPTEEGEVGEPMPGVRVSVVGPHGEPLEVGKQGTLICKLPDGMGGTAVGVHDRDTAPNGNVAAGWIVTRDLAYLGERGRVHIVGRTDDVIVKNGRNIDPFALEGAIMANLAVGRCVVTSVNTRLGVVKTIAVCETDDRTITETTLRQWCRANLAPGDVPDRFILVDDLPKTSEGKILRMALNELVRSAEAG